MVLQWFAMIVQVFDVNDVLALKTKNHAPVSAHGYRPESITLTLKAVQPETRQSQIPWMRCRIKNAEDQPQLAGMCGLNSRFAARSEKSL
jgi:hypothetical protein